VATGDESAPPTFACIPVSIFSSTHPSTYPPIYLSTCSFPCPSIFASVSPSVNHPSSTSFHASTYPGIPESTHTPMHPSIHASTQYPYTHPPISKHLLCHEYLLCAMGEPRWVRTTSAVGRAKLQVAPSQFLTPRSTILCFPCLPSQLGQPPHYLFQPEGDR
jgi:hypothetical protein